MHRVVVIGCGLFGSAATRYLAEQFDGVLCVGPGEPQDKKAHGGVFGSHYNEGRMTTKTFAKALWWLMMYTLRGTGMEEAIDEAALALNHTIQMVFFVLHFVILIKI